MHGVELHHVPISHLLVISMIYHPWLFVSMFYVFCLLSVKYVITKCKCYFVQIAVQTTPIENE